MTVSQLLGPRLADLSWKNLFTFCGSLNIRMENDVPIHELFSLKVDADSIINKWAKFSDVISQWIINFIFFRELPKYDFQVHHKYMNLRSTLASHHHFKKVCTSEADGLKGKEVPPCYLSDFHSPDLPKQQYYSASCFLRLNIA